VSPVRFWPSPPVKPFNNKDLQSRQKWLSSFHGNTGVTAERSSQNGENGHQDDALEGLRLSTALTILGDLVIAYVGRRTAQGLSKKNIVRYRERFVDREIYRSFIDDHCSRAVVGEAA
jgi:hypothetical protein